MGFVALDLLNFLRTMMGCGYTELNCPIGFFFFH